MADDMRIQLDVRGNPAAEIRDAITDAAKRATDHRASRSGFGEEIKEDAQDTIRNAGAVFTGDLMESFSVTPESASGVWRVTIENTSDHAAPIEYGAEYGTEGPPIAALIPWVAAKMQGYDVPDDGLKDVPEPEDIREQSNDLTYGDDIIAFASDEILEKAFWLQQHIKEEGIDALHYMARAEREVASNIDSKMAAYIASELRS